MIAHMIAGKTPEKQIVVPILAVTSAERRRDVADHQADGVRRRAELNAGCSPGCRDPRRRVLPGPILLAVASGGVGRRRRPSVGRPARCAAPPVGCAEARSTRCWARTGRANPLCRSVISAARCAPTRGQILWRGRDTRRAAPRDALAARHRHGDAGDQPGARPVGAGEHLSAAAGPAGPSLARRCAAPGGRLLGEPRPGDGVAAGLARCGASRRRSGSSSRSPRPWRCRPSCSSSTNRPPRCRPGEVERLFDIMATAATGGRGAGLRLAPAGGGVRHHRPGHGAARGPHRCRLARNALAEPGRADPPHGRSGCGVRTPGAVGARTGGDQPVVLECQHLRAPPAVRDVSFAVGRGEILGLGGLVGAGRSETVEAIFGAAAAHRRERHAEGQAVSRRSGRQAPSVPGSGWCRKTGGRRSIVPDFSVRENLLLAPSGRAHRG